MLKRLPSVGKRIHKDGGYETAPWRPELLIDNALYKRVVHGHLDFGFESAFRAVITNITNMKVE
jgi:hypothetical protein